MLYCCHEVTNLQTSGQLLSTQLYKYIKTADKQYHTLLKEYGHLQKNAMVLRINAEKIYF